MDYNDIHELINSGKYKYPDFMDMIEPVKDTISKEELEELGKVHRKECNKIDQEFSNDVIKFIMDTYNLGLNSAKIIFDNAYEIGHSLGFSRVLEYSNRYGDMVSDIILSEENI